MRAIEKKVLPEYFEAILQGKKKYELRLNDFEVSEGDMLFLREWSSETQNYTGRELKRKVTYVGKFFIDKLFWSEDEINKKGLQILSLE